MPADLIALAFSVGSIFTLILFSAGLTVGWYLRGSK